MQILNMPIGEEKLRKRLCVRVYEGLFDDDDEIQRFLETIA